MGDRVADPILDQLLRHMAFADATLFDLLLPLPPATLVLTARRGGASVAARGVATAPSTTFRGSSTQKREPSPGRLSHSCNST